MPEDVWEVIKVTKTMGGIWHAYEITGMDALADERYGIDWP